MIVVWVFREQMGDTIYGVAWLVTKNFEILANLSIQLQTNFIVRFRW